MGQRLSTTNSSLLFFRKGPILPETAAARVVARIRAAEERTTGEVRVFVERRCRYVDAMDRAVQLFAQLGMARTERRNACIVYVAVADHQYAIFGDEEIYARAGGPRFWEAAAEKLRTGLRAGDVAGAVADCVDTLADALSTHFPYDPAVTRNELPDEIVFGK